MIEKPPTSIQIYVSRSKINKALTLLFYLNIFFLAGTWLIHSPFINRLPLGETKVLFQQLNLTTENVAAAWYSSMLLLLVAITAFLCFLSDARKASKTKEKILNIGWIGMVLIFLLLSFDEMGSFHEMIGESPFFAAISGTPYGGWRIFFLLIAAVAVFMMSFFVVKFLKNKWSMAFAILGALLFISNPFQEDFEISSYRNAIDPATWRRPVYFMLLEEGSEIFASFCFLISFSKYLKYSLGANTLKNNSDHLKLNIVQKKSAAAWVLIALTAVGILMIVVKVNALHLKGEDAGIPQNWFPAAIACITGIVCLYLYFIGRKSTAGKITLALAIVSLLASIFYGSNMVSFTDNVYAKFGVLIITGTVAVGGLALYQLPGNYVKATILLWIVLCFVSFMSADFYNTSLAYLSYSILFTGILYFFAQSSQKKIAPEVVEQQKSVAELTVLT